MSGSEILTQRLEGRFYPFAQGVNADLKTGIVQFAKQPSGTLSMKDVPVFRSGTFRDSWGEQTTWTDEDLNRMVQNFEQLRSSRLLDDIPVRDGHPSFLSGGPGAGEVVGWHSGLRTEKLESHDGNDYTYLLADFEITEPHAAGKVERRTWRNRSAEIGTYGTNGDVEYSPVYMGFAYVDIPAVEGLKINGHSRLANFNKDSGNRFFFMAGRDSSVPTTATTAPTGAGTDTSPTPTTPPPTPAPAPTPAPPAPAPAPVPSPTTPAAQQHSAPVQVLEFRVNGGVVSDFAAVQRHIDTLEKFQKESVEQARRDFVTSLATDNKILANEETIKSLTEFALGLSPEQFVNWKGTFSATPGNPALANHGTQSGGTPARDERTERIEVLKETIQQHTYAGMSRDKIEKLDSYKELQQLLAQG